jgi:outer membrane immunogenic protein
MTLWRSVLAATAVLGCSAAASAADLPYRAAPPPYVPPPMFTWTGFYAGVNAGYVFDNDTRIRVLGGTGTATGLGTTRPTSIRSSDDGFTGGGQIGYNWQFGAGSGIVIGVEADIAYTDLQRTRSIFTDRLSQFRTSLDYLGTVRGRLGYSFGRFLVYGTGGLAYGDVESRADFFSPGGALVFTGRRDDTRTGLAYGGGVEFALPSDSFLNFFHSSAVTLKGEFLHYDLGRNRVTIANTAAIGAGAYNSRFETEGNLFRAGLNYKF